LPKNERNKSVSNLTPISHRLSRAERSRIKNHQPAVLWFTGLSASGKSTIANLVEYRLNKDFAAHTFLLDGDNVRMGLNKDLGFSDADRSENIRRIGEVAKLFFDAGLIVLTAFISPFQADRDLVRALLPPGGFYEIYVRCPLAVCEQRDPKGLYRKARQGQIPDFTGISSPYEAPEKPELLIDSHQSSLEECVTAVLALCGEGILSKPSSVI
jgi:adenylylsulfate kinase